MRPPQPWEIRAWNAHRHTQESSCLGLPDYYRLCTLTAYPQFLQRSGLLVGTACPASSASPAPVQVEHRLFALFGD